MLKIVKRLTRGHCLTRADSRLHTGHTKASSVALMVQRTWMRTGNGAEMRSNIFTPPPARANPTEDCSLQLTNHKAEDSFGAWFRCCNLSADTILNVPRQIPQIFLQLLILDAYYISYYTKSFADWVWGSVVVVELVTQRAPSQTIQPWGGPPSTMYTCSRNLGRKGAHVQPVGRCERQCPGPGGFSA